MAGEFSGVLQQFWGVAESTYDTAIAIAATDAVNLRSLELTPEKSYEEIVSHAGSGTYEGEIGGATGGKWSATCDMMPTSAGTAPDIGFALKAGFGTETVSGGTSVTYSFNDTAPQSLSWTKYAGSSFYERANGASVETITFEGGRGEIPRIVLAGSYATHAFLYGLPTVSGVNATGVSTVNLTATHGYKIGIGAYIGFGADTNSGNGYRVTGTTSSTVTFTPTLAGAGTSGGEAVVPVVPSQTLAGTRIGGVSHGLTMDAVAVNPITMKFTIDTGIRLLDKESASSKPTGILRQLTRSVTFDIDAYFKATSMPAFSAAHFSSEVVRDFAARYGADTAAARVKVNCDKAVPRVQPVVVQDAEVTQIKFGGRARKNSAANDECTVVFD